MSTLFKDRDELNRNRRWLAAYVFAASGALHETVEIVEQVLEIAWEQSASLQDGADSSAWLRGVVRQTIAHYYEGRVRQPSLKDNGAMIGVLDRATDAIENDLLSPETERDRISRFKECIRKLPDAERIIMNLRYNRRFSTAQIAERLGYAPEEVHERLFNGLFGLLEAADQKPGNEPNGLILKYLDCNSRPDDMSQLQTLLTDDPRLAQLLIRSADNELLILTALAEIGTLKTVEHEVPQLRKQRGRTLSQRGGSRKRWIAAIVLIAAVCMIAFLLSRR